MSEQDEQRPLTRRERRLREMAETGALDLSEVSGAAAVPSAAPAAPADPEGEIEISPFHEDGTPRSRREMRELREQALAELAARRAANEAEAAGREEAAPEGDDGAEASEGAQASEAEEPDDVDAPVSAEAAGDAGARADAEAGGPEGDRAEESLAPEAEPASDAADGDTPDAEEETPETEAPEPEPAVDEPAAGETAEPEAPEPAADETGADAVPAPIPAVRPAAPAGSSAEQQAETGLTEGEPVDDRAPADVTGALDFDSLIAPPTEPFTVADLAEATAGEGREDESEDEAAPVDETPAEPTRSEKPKRRFPWQRKAASDTAAAEPSAPEAAEAVEAEAPEAGAGEAPAQPADATRESTVDAAAEGPAAAPEPDPGAVEEAEAVAEIAEPAGSADEAAQPAEQSPEQKTTYSFPDIAPPEEWRSVFDDPASRRVPEQGGPGGDFDDLISRAVAQEGTATTAGTSALILPSMPEDTGGLAGPIGTTGELYVTGSLRLPKSLGETGGHSALHDSIEMDPITGEETGDAQLTSEGPAPVSARHAVSARAASGLPVVAKPAKERSKLPLVLSLTGGGLLVAVVALGVWGASNGMFG